MRINDSVPIEPMRWEGFSHEKIFSSVAGERTSTESMYSVSASLAGHGDSLQAALAHAEAGYAEYLAASEGSAADAGAEAISASVESLRSFVQSAAVVPEVIAKVAERFDVAKGQIAELPPRSTSRYDAEDLPMSWLLPPPADQRDSDEIAKRRWAREAMAGYERDVAAELNRLPEFIPAQRGGPAGQGEPASPAFQQPLPGAPSRTDRTPAIVDGPTEPIRHVPPVRSTTPRPVRVAWQPPAAPSTGSWDDFGPTGHAAEDVEFDEQQSVGRPEPEVERPSWRSDVRSKPVAAPRRPTSLFESDEATVPPVIGLLSDEPR